VAAGVRVGEVGRPGGYAVIALRGPIGMGHTSLQGCKTNVFSPR